MKRKSFISCRRSFLSAAFASIAAMVFPWREKAAPARPIVSDRPLVIPPPGYMIERITIEQSMFTHGTQFTVHAVLRETPAFVNDAH